MKKLTRSEKLNFLLKIIADKLNKATSKQEAKSKNLDFYYQIEFSSIYGGYRIIDVKVDSGAHYGAFGGNGTEARLKFADMLLKLNTILNTINEIKN